MNSLRSDRPIASYNRWLALPTTLWLLIFFLIPLLIVLAVSFHTRSPRGAISLPLTTENYTYVTSDFYWPVFERSLMMALYTTLICLGLGYPLAFFISTRRNTNVRQISLFLVILPFWTNFLIRTYAWRVLLAREGIFNHTLQSLGLIDEPLQLLFTQQNVILGLVYAYLPYMVLPIYASLVRFDFRLVEAGHDLGGNDWLVFWRVLFPITLPGVVAGSLLVFIPTIGSYVIPDMLGGVDGVMIGNLIARNFRGTGHWPRGAAASMVLMGIVTIGLILYALFAQEEGFMPTQRTRRRSPLGRTQATLPARNLIGWLHTGIARLDNQFARLSALRRRLTLGADLQIARDRWLRRIGQVMLWALPIFCFAFLWLPIVVLVVFSFNSSRSTATWNGFSTAWYHNILNNAIGGETRFSTELMMNSLQNSLHVSILATIISTILGTACALALARSQFRGKALLLGLLYLPVAIPEIAQGVSLLIFFDRAFDMLNPWLENITGNEKTLNFGFSTMIIGHVAFSVSYIAVIVWTRLLSISETLEEAAHDLGANRWQTFWRVTFPLALPGVIGGALLAFTVSLDDYVVSFFTAGIGTTNLTIFVYGLLKQTITPEINAISTVMIVVSTLLVTISLIVQNLYAKQL